MLFDLKEHSKLFDALSGNLIKNSRTLRLLSLNLLRRFRALHFLAVGEEQSSEQYATTKPCNCFELMYQFEKTEISFMTEKNKQAQLEKLEVMTKFGVVPVDYHQALYNFFIGCLWIKFKPLFPAVHKCVATLINSTSSESKENLIK